MYISATIVPFDSESIEVRLSVANDPNARLETLEQIAKTSCPMIRYCIYKNPVAAPLVEQHPEWFDFEDEDISYDMGCNLDIIILGDADYDTIKEAIQEALAKANVSLLGVSLVDDIYEDDDSDINYGEIMITYGALPSFSEDIAEYIDEILESLDIEVTDGESW